MTPEQFCYWLQGYFEINRANPQKTKLNEQQIEIINDHLNLVFNKQTPVRQGLKEPATDREWIEMANELAEQMKDPKGPKYNDITKPPYNVTCSDTTVTATDAVSGETYCATIPESLEKALDEIDVLKKSMGQISKRPRNGGKAC